MIVFYSGKEFVGLDGKVKTGCPKCAFIKDLLVKKKVDFKTEYDENLMVELGFKTIPMLDVHGEIMDFNKAFKYLTNIEMEE